MVSYPCSKYLVVTFHYFNALIGFVTDEVRRRGIGQAVLFVIDGTDRLRRDEAEGFFIHDIHQLRLVHGNFIYCAPINILTEESGFEFSELIGNGTQEPVALVNGFTGIWDAKLPDIDRSIGLIELKQDGAVVTGCFGTSDLVGSVTGNIARMTGIDRFDGVMSAYIFGLNADGELVGVASNNGGRSASCRAT